MHMCIFVYFLNVRACVDACMFIYVSEYETCVCVCTNYTRLYECFAHVYLCMCGSGYLRVFVRVCVRESMCLFMCVSESA